MSLFCLFVCGGVRACWGVCVVPSLQEQPWVKPCQSSIFTFFFYLFYFILFYFILLFVCVGAGVCSCVYVVPSLQGQPCVELCQSLFFPLPFSFLDVSNWAKPQLLTVNSLSQFSPIVYFIFFIDLLP